MRTDMDRQLPIQFRQVQWGRETRLQKIDEILASSSEAYESAAQDLNREVCSRAGAKGMTAEQVVRVALLKKLKDYSYEELYDRLTDSERFRYFTRLFDDEIPKPSTLHENVKKLSANTWEKLNQLLLKFADQKGIEDGKASRVDTTGVETNIHHPTDSNLLWDCVRVLTRLMGAVKDCVAGSWRFHNHTRKAKKLLWRINNAKSKQKRIPLHRELLDITSKTQGYAQKMLSQLRTTKPSSVEERTAINVFTEEFQRYLDLTQRVVDQCRRRVLEDEKVPAEEKVLSIFEVHTDIIEKGNRETIFGHKICVNGGQSRLILDCIIERGNPADTSLLPTTLDRHVELYGHAPEALAADHGFRSEDNAHYAQTKGVKDICFSTHPGVEVTEWVRSLQVFKKLRNFRAGIEGCISTMKRVLGLDRCTWRGFESFCSYVWLSIVSFNLRVLADHLLG